MIRVLLILSALLGAFSIWGLRSDSGARMFDEMAGMVPFGAGLLAIVLLIAAILMSAWRIRATARTRG